MEILSVFEDYVKKKKYPALSKDMIVDVTVIGGGITGVTAAYLLSRQNKSVALVEAHEIGKGATGNSTGNLYATVGNKGLHGIKSKFDKETMSNVVKARGEAVNFIESLVNEFKIDCDFKRIPWCLFSEEDKQSYVDKEEHAAKDAGLNVSHGIKFPFKIATGFKLENQAQFNPFKYVIGLAENTSNGCEIFENTKVTDVEEQNDSIIVHTSGGKITCKDVVMATHTPKGVYQVHSMMGVYREYAIAVTLNGEYPADGTYWNHLESEHYSMRTYENEGGKVLMILGETHKVGQKDDNRECFENLEKFVRQHFSVEKIAYKWAAQQYKPADTLPYIGRTTDSSRVYIATGFSADGLTYGTLASMIITDQILGRKNKWSEIFDAQRHTPLDSAGEVIKENINVAAQYIKDLPFIGDVSNFEDVQNGSGKVVEVEGEKFAAYRDKDGQLHVVSAVCTHMKCIVNWNTSEKSWDCPCHGSRFNCEGEVIEGPAIADLYKLKNDKL